VGLTGFAEIGRAQILTSFRELYANLVAQSRYTGDGAFAEQAEVASGAPSA
jgi:hypothetical protein